VCTQVRLGEHNIVANYFEQNQAEALDPQLSVLDTLVRAAPDAKLNDLKQLLGRMLFSGSAMDKKVCCGVFFRGRVWAGGPRVVAPHLWM
jgi:ATPase subunit of ABC transporter with duplicated ATPase domains